MRRVLTIVLGFLILPCWLFAQQTPQFTQYLFNHFAINPALAGIEECVDMRVGHRQQWMGFEGAPVTSWGSIHFPIPQKKKKHLKIKHGVGAYAESDNLGPFGKTSIYLAYAYHFPLTLKIMASAGLYAGLQQFRFGSSEISVADFDDPAIGGSTASFIYPDVTPGFWLHTDKWYGGLSIRHVIGNGLPVGTDSDMEYHFQAVAGKKIPGEDGWSFIPSVMFKFATVSAPSFDLNLLMDYTDNIQFGFSYRNTDAIAAMVKFRVLKYFSVGYSFDFTTSQLRHASSNTHEIIIGINGCGGSAKDTYSCPAFN